MNRYIAISSLTAVGLSLAAAAAEVDLQSLVAEADRAARGEVDDFTPFTTLVSCLYL